jgi:DNA-binding transcriptional regulator LsrR (DeoR family)
MTALVLSGCSRHTGGMTPSRTADVGSERVDQEEVGLFAYSLLYAAATMYYNEDATQAEVAKKLGTSRATVSRILAEARRQGVVRIEVVPRAAAGNRVQLAHRLCMALGLDQVYLSEPLRSGTASWSPKYLLGSVLAPAVGTALSEAGLKPGDVLLVSSGRTMFEVSQFDLPKLSGVVVAPTLGGTDQPEDWYQTNEIARLMASRVDGRATYLFAPALPGPDLYQTLQNDPAIQQVVQLWPQAQCALVGIGAAPMLRPQLPKFIAPAAASLVGAVGDVCSRFYDPAGEPIDFPGSERLIAVELATLQSIPLVIAVAVGQEKVGSIIAGARSRYFNRLVTDPDTADKILNSYHFQA